MTIRRRSLLVLSGAALAGPAAAHHGWSSYDAGKVLTLKGAILDGQLFEGKAGCTELSKLPTKAEAIVQVVTLIVSPAKKLMGQIKGPGSAVAGIIKSIEGKLEKGETIAKLAG